ncbi:type II toxin-antitoxin system RelE/ParE family toxin [Synechococcus sp. CS-1327]|nr:type II toxin-antitoxin system RelE/ParE family toxin [Synechococcus sp. CS-1326]MCT0234632.1 type II toxin-antitoxin system RelE/ParE family toxin [Synechococcus sp. CS-1327]
MQAVSIQSFACKRTKAIWEGENPPKFAAIARQAEKKLSQLDSAADLHDLKFPPSNHLEELNKEKKWRGYHCIRVNDQWRLCFRWTQAGPMDVQIVDYKL